MRWPIERLLVGTDFSPSAGAALEVAASLARHTGAQVDLLHCLFDPDDDGKRAKERMRQQAEEAGVPDANLIAVPGEPADQLSRLRDELGADLVVAGAAGLRGVRGFLLGSVADRMLRRPGAPLLLVREARGHGQLKRIAVGLELPDVETPALQAAVRLAGAMTGELCVIHALPPRGYLSDRRHVEMHPDTVVQRIEAAVARLDASIPFQTAVHPGDPAEEITLVVQKLDPDLLVLGAERNPDGWPGRVADRLARMGPAALLLVWPEPEGG
jgi:nucleotide-binding universal stress UspA family protein